VKPGKRYIVQHTKQQQFSGNISLARLGRASHLSLLRRLNNSAISTVTASTFASSHVDESLHSLRVCSRASPSGRRTFSSQPPNDGGKGGMQLPPWLMGQQKQPGEYLKEYCTDLTELAANNKFDPIIGRHEEIRRAIQVLSRRTKNCPVLIGAAGVGKVSLFRKGTKRHEFEGLTLTQSYRNYLTDCHR
jgi:ATP-dependent Clp protease ATP-binding subunit ClpA